MTKPKIIIKRIHQKNGPDYFEANCYFQDYSLIARHMTKQKALDKMFDKIDGILYEDWYMAHRLNKFFDNEKLLRKELELREKWEKQFLTPRPEPVKPKGKLWLRLIEMFKN